MNCAWSYVVQLKMNLYTHGVNFFLQYYNCTLGERSHVTHEYKHTVTEIDRGSYIQNLTLPICLLIEKSILK